MFFVDNIKKRVSSINKSLLLIILVFACFVIGGTYAYFFSSGFNNNVITGNAGIIDLELDVTRVLPVDETVNSILLFQFDELADNLNADCIDQDGDYSLCHLYKINLKNKSNTINTKIKGSLAFDNETMPNLSWILLGNTYSSSTDYTSDMFGDTFNTASSTYTSFVDNYVLNSDSEINYYILLWVNETDEIQYDSGSFTGVVRFEDGGGNGITAEFSGYGA